jgi:hypothetical protein
MLLPCLLLSHLVPLPTLQLLRGLLQVVEASGCAHVPTATTTNEWRAAFDDSYNTVLSDFSVPSGKNRYHKFRDKIVEIWKAMEENTEFIADNNPLYAIAHRQYGDFLEVTNERKAAIALDDRKQAPSSSPRSHKKDTSKAKSKSMPAARSAASATSANPTPAATPVTGTKKRPAVGMPPTTAPIVATTQLASVGFATLARDMTANKPPSIGFATLARDIAASTSATLARDIAASTSNQSELSQVLLSKLETITVLLQTANNNPQMPPKLPILLNDLHRIRVRTTDPEELAIVKPYYLDLLNNHLQAIEYKIRSDSVILPHPASLMVDLEGMDLLRQGLRNDTEMLDMVHTTYQRVLIKYLKMVNPRIPAIAKQKRPREV